MSYTIKHNKVDALAVIKEVAIYLRDNGKDMWNIEELSYENNVEEKEESFVVLYDEEKPIGALILRGMQDFDRIAWKNQTLKEALYVHRLSIIPEYTKRGLSKLLVDFAIGFCRENKIKALRLDTDNNFPKLVKLYEKYGFSIVGYEDMNVDILGDIKLVLFEKIIK